MNHQETKAEKEEKTIILADSCTDVPAEVAHQLGIRIIPVHIIYPERDYRDGIDLDSGMIYKRFPNEIPTTSTPSLQEIMDVFENIQAQGYNHVISIHISDHLSSTVNMISVAAENFPDIRTYVFNTKNISIGSGIYAIWAAVQLRRGASFEKIVAGLEKRRSSSVLLFYMDSLEYLYKGGRIGNVTYMLTQALRIRPIIRCDQEGVYYTAAKVHGGSRSGREKLYEKVFGEVGDRQCWVVIPYGAAPEEADRLEEMIRDRRPNAQILFKMQITASLAVHTGPGLLGLEALIEPDE